MVAIAANLLLLFLLIGLVTVTVGKRWFVVQGTGPTTATTTRTAGTLAGEPVDSKAADFIAAFQLNLWTSAGDPTAPYPDYYAGAYYEKPLSLQGFTVLVTCDPSLVKSALDGAASGAISSFVLPMTIVQVKHSYNELLIQYNAVQKVLGGQTVNLSEADQAIIAHIEKVGIDEKGNKIFIEVKDGTGLEKETLYRILHSLYGYSFVDTEILVNEAEIQPKMSTNDAVNIFREYFAQNSLKLHGDMDGEWGGLNIKLPDSFSSVMDGFNIGEFLMQMNELSKQNGLDFSDYLGKIVTVCPDDIETSDGLSPIQVVGFVADGKMVGFWKDEDAESWEQTDFRVIFRYLSEVGFK